MRSVIILSVILVLNACMSSKNTLAFLKRCNEESKIDNSRTCLTSVLELKQSLPKERPMFYLGSDTLFHYFIFAYDKTTKLSSRFRIAKSEIKLKNEFSYGHKESKKDFPVYLSDL
jgi:hypothetical protein